MKYKLVGPISKNIGIVEIPSQKIKLEMEEEDDLNLLI